MRRAQVIAAQAINERGVSLYNSGDVAGCANLYANVADQLVQHQLPANARAILTSGLDAARACAGEPDAQAWELRSALDRFIGLREQETSQTSARESSSPALSFVDGMCTTFQSIDDRVMGGRSQSAMTHSIELGAAIFSGELSTANNGGFASVRGPVNWNLSRCPSVRITAASPTGGVFKLRLHDTSQVDAVSFEQNLLVPPDNKFRTYELAVDRFVGDWRGRPQPGAPAS